MIPLPILAIGGAALAAWWWKRTADDNSAKEDQAEQISSTCDPQLATALGWPYWYGEGSPSTPWEAGPQGVDCSGFAQMALVRLNLLASSAADRSALGLANGSDPIEVGLQQVGDLAYYPGHVMVVCAPPGADGHSPVIGSSGGYTTTKGDDPNARVKLFGSARYRDDFVTYCRLRA